MWKCFLNIWLVYSVKTLAWTLPATKVSSQRWLITSSIIPTHIHIEQTSTTNVRFCEAVKEWLFNSHPGKCRSRKLSLSPNTCTCMYVPCVYVCVCTVYKQSSYSCAFKHQATSIDTVPHPVLTDEITHCTALHTVASWEYVIAHCSILRARHCT